MKKIKILQFPIANSKGGMTRYALENWKWMDKDRFKCDFATMSKHLDFEDEIRATGSNIFFISCYAEKDENRFKDEFRKILIEGEYDIVHLHTKHWKSFLAEQIANEIGVKKVIVHAHNTDIGILDEEKRETEKRSHQHMLEGLTEGIATDFWACSWKAAEFLFGEKIPKHKIEIMNNAIDVSKYAFDPNIRKQYRDNLDIEEDEYVIGNVGRLVYQKNQEFLLDVYINLCKKNNDDKTKFKLLLVGSGEREKEYKEIVQKSGLNDKVVFTGQREDVTGLLQAMDIFCLPSRFEGLPISLVEAQASGLPCIASDQITTESILTNSTFLLPLDTQLWEEKIKECSGVVNKRENKKKELTQKGYDIKDQIKRVEKTYMHGVRSY